MNEQCHLLEQTFLRGLIKKVIKFMKVNQIIMSYYYNKVVLFVSHCVILYPHLINMSRNLIDSFVRLPYYSVSYNKYRSTINSFEECLYLYL